MMSDQNPPILEFEAEKLETKADRHMALSELKGLSEKPSPLILFLGFDVISPEWVRALAANNAWGIDYVQPSDAYLVSKVQDWKVEFPYLYKKLIKRMEGRCSVDENGYPNRLFQMTCRPKSFSGQLSRLSKWFNEKEGRFTLTSSKLIFFFEELRSLSQYAGYLHLVESDKRGKALILFLLDQLRVKLDLGEDEWLEGFITKLNLLDDPIGYLILNSDELNSLNRIVVSRLETIKEESPTVLPTKVSWAIACLSELGAQFSHQGNPGIFVLLKQLLWIEEDSKTAGVKNVWMYPMVSLGDEDNVVNMLRLDVHDEAVGIHRISAINRLIEARVDQLLIKEEFLDEYRLLEGLVREVGELVRRAKTIVTHQSFPPTLKWIAGWELHKFQGTASWCHLFHARRLFLSKMGDDKVAARKSLDEAMRLAALNVRNVEGVPGQVGRSCNYKIWMHLTEWLWDEQIKGRVKVLDLLELAEAELPTTEAIEAELRKKKPKIAFGLGYALLTYAYVKVVDDVLDGEKDYPELFEYHFNRFDSYYRHAMMGEAKEMKEGDYAWALTIVVLCFLDEKVWLLRLDSSDEGGKSPLSHALKFFNKSEFNGRVIHKVIGRKVVILLAYIYSENERMLAVSGSLGLADYYTQLSRSVSNPKSDSKLAFVRKFFELPY